MCCFAVLEGGYNQEVLGQNVTAFLDGLAMVIEINTLRTIQAFSLFCKDLASFRVANKKPAIHLSRLRVLWP